MLVDLHAHQLTEGMLNLHEHWGPFWTGAGLRIGNWELKTKMPSEARAASRTASDSGTDLAAKFAPEVRLAQMDSFGVDKLVVSVPAHTFMYWAEPEFGLRYAHTANDELAAWCAAAPDRLYFWAHAPLQDPSAAVKEVERAITELGARGLSVGGRNFGGLEFDSEDLFPVWEKMCELDLPLFVHGYNQSVTWDDPDIDRYDASSILGMCEDEVVCFWNLTQGGVLDRFPELKVYITHAGGYVPYQLGRLEVLSQTMAPDSKSKRPLAEYLPNFWFDPLMTHVSMRRAIVDIVGVDRVLYGDNFAGADMIDFDLTEGLDLSVEDREKIRSTNALALLKL